MIPNNLTILIKMVYGRALYYPGDYATGKLAELIGKKTFSGGDLEILTRLGFEITYKEQKCV